MQHVGKTKKKSAKYATGSRVLQIPSNFPNRFNCYQNVETYFKCFENNDAKAQDSNVLGILENLLKFRRICPETPDM